MSKLDQDLAANLADDLEAISFTQDAARDGNRTKNPSAENTDKPLELMSLPQKIIGRILGLLLDAKDVKAYTPAPTRRCLPDYKFSTSVLCVNKSLSAIGLKIFRQNHFILVSTSDAKLFKSLYDDGVWYCQKRISRFKHYKLRVHLVSKLSVKGKNEFFMMCRDNVKDLILQMRAANMLEQRCWDLKFQVHNVDGSLQEHQKRELFAPFLKLRTREQVCSVKGDIDTRSAVEIEEQMEPMVKWAREQGWQLLELLTYMKDIGDNLAKAKQFLRAQNAYRAFLDFRTKISQYASYVIGPDRNLSVSFMRLYQVAYLNAWLVDAILATNTQDAKDYRSEYKGHITAIKKFFPQDDIPVDEQARYHLLLGLDCISQGKIKDAMAAFSASRKLKSSRCMMVLVVAISSLIRSRSAAESKDEFHKRFQAESAALLATALNSAELAPLPFDGPAKVSVSEHVEFERYVLRRIGYTGDLLEDKVVQKPGFTFDPYKHAVVEGDLDIAAADAWVAKLKHHIATGGGKPEDPIVEFMLSVGYWPPPSAECPQPFGNDRVSKAQMGDEVEYIGL